MNAVETCRRQTDHAQASQLVGNALERGVPRRARRLACPGEHARRRIRLGNQQRLEALALRRGQAAGELLRRMPFHQRKCGRDEALDDG